MTKLTMLGTGHAMVTKCYNTCFVLQNEKGAVLIDAGGGNGILVQMERAGIDWKSMRAMFLTHAHTDHILGAIWVLRKINSLMKQGKYEGDFTLYGLREGLDFLESSCRFLLKDPLGEKIHFEAVENDDEFSTINICFTVFDIYSHKMPQIGFRALTETLSLVCLGDEPYNEKCRPYVENADWLLCEAFCLYQDREKYKPYEKRHSTALDAGRAACDLHAGNLVMYHTEDSDLENRKENYVKEAAENFDGNIYVPDDLETIVLG
ncbi:MAG: MBL fold metallo-hydrolase [Roseburia sp.]|nr:MBL fold metallo-hydrolase [Roseburia sp.]MCM1242527.1 MBL fold metallo-hydrolase [Roseburia sp.]